MIQALIFDFDGLILDTEVPDYQSWQEAYQEHGCDLPLSIWTPYIGNANILFDVYGELERQLGCSIDRTALRIKRRHRYAELVAAQSPLPGVVDYITTAHQLGLKLAVASSGTREWVCGHLERLSLLSYFDCTKCFEDVKRTKPDPELYLAALSSLDVPASAAIAIEDSPNGILAAKRAGLFCIAVPNKLTSQLALEHADLQLAALNSLPLAELLSRFTTNR